MTNGGAGISGTPSVSVVPSNPYHIYPMAESLQNYNAATGKMDASALVTTVEWNLQFGRRTAGGHYFNYKMDGIDYNSNAWNQGFHNQYMTNLSGYWARTTTHSG